MTALRIDSLSYAPGGRVLLDKISYAGGDGGCTALLGPNGAGKSLLLEMCHGLRTPDEGDIFWFGRRLNGLRDDIAITLQKPTFLMRSVYANLRYVLGVRRTPRAQRDARIRGILAEVGLEDKADDPVSALSGGEQQCLSIARALLLEPRAVLLDEPTAQLDLAATERVERIMTRLRNAGTKVIFTSHNPAQVRRLCDEVIFMDKGSLVACAPRDEFFTHISHPAARAFIRSQSLL